MSFAAEREVRSILLAAAFQYDPMSMFGKGETLEEYREKAMADIEANFDSEWEKTKESARLEHGYDESNFDGAHKQAHRQSKINTIDQTWEEAQQEKKSQAYGVSMALDIEMTLRRLSFMMISVWPLYSIEWTEDIAMVVTPIESFETDFWAQMNRVMRCRMTFRQLSELRVKVSEQLRGAHLTYLQLKTAADDRAKNDEAKPPTSWSHATKSPYLSMMAIVDLAAMQVVQNALFQLMRPENAPRFAQLCDRAATFPREMKIAFPDAIEIKSFAKRAPLIPRLVPFMHEELIKMGTQRMVSGVIADLTRFLDTYASDDGGEDIYDLLASVKDTSRIVRLKKRRPEDDNNSSKKTQEQEEEEDDEEKDRELSKADVITALLETMQWDAKKGQLGMDLLEDYELPEDYEPVSIGVAYKQLGKWLESNVFVHAVRSLAPTYVHAYASIKPIAIHLGTHIRAIFLTRSEEDQEDFHSIIKSPPLPL